MAARASAFATGAAESTSALSAPNGRPRAAHCCVPHRHACRLAERGGAAEPARVSARAASASRDTPGAGSVGSAPCRPGQPVERARLGRRRLRVGQQRRHEVVCARAPARSVPGSARGLTARRRVGRAGGQAGGRTSVAASLTRSKESSNGWCAHQLQAEPSEAAALSQPRLIARPRRSSFAARRDAASASGRSAGRQRPAGRRTDSHKLT